jgi:hypothetical protein
MAAKDGYDWDHNPASILDTIDLHLRFRLFKRADKARQDAIGQLAAKLGISPTTKVEAAVDAVGVVDPEVQAKSPNASTALRVLWSLHPKASRTPRPVLTLGPKAAVLVRRIRKTLANLRPPGESTPDQGKREGLVALLGELFKIDGQRAEGVAVRLLASSLTPSLRTPVAWR